jgi:hypothetical protein
MRWVILFLVLVSCAGQHSSPTYDNFNKKCLTYLLEHKIHWNNCEDKLKALEDIHNNEIDIWRYKKTF